MSACRHAKAGGGVATALAGTQTFSAQRVPVAAGSGRGGGVGAVAAVGTPPRAFSLALYPPGGVCLAECDAAI